MTETTRQPIAVIGALAYDQICTTSSSLLDESKPLLNSKLARITESFGGCGGNIAYNLARLRHPVVLITCSGSQDDERYLRHLQAHHIDIHPCLRLTGHGCARAIIFTDPDGRQFTGFHPGPVPELQQWHRHLAGTDFKAALIHIQAPYPPALMHASLEHTSMLSCPPLRIFAPGQYTDQLNAAQAQSLLALSDWVVGNEYEIRCLAEQQMLNEKLLIQTDGKHPVKLRFTDGSSTRVPVTAVARAVDPTGCGDALLAGLSGHLARIKAMTPTTLRQFATGKDAAGRALLCAAIEKGCTLAAECLTRQGPQLPL